MGSRLSAKSEEKTEEVYEPSKATRLYIVWRKLRRSELAVIGFGIVLIVSIVALLAPLIAPHSPEWTGDSRVPPSLEHPFGTDVRGRDMYSMVIYGARISLYVGLAAESLTILIGLAIGMTAGYFGGIIDDILMRLTDVVLTLPTLPFLIVTVSMFEVRSIHIISLVIGILEWPFLARVVRSEFLSLREATYVEAARSMGATNWRIIIHHILPNLVSVITVLATLDIPWIILYEATLTFLGFGDPSSPSWGILIEKGYMFMTTSWWLITIPGLALVFTSLGFNLFGDGLRDALDVKVRE